MNEGLTPQAKGIVEKVQASANDSLSLEDIALASIIPQDKEIPKPEIVFGMDDIPMFTKKSVSTLIGKAKSGKTTCTAWIVSKILSGGATVLWLDTEQGEYYGSRTQHWILKIAGLDHCPTLFYADLKEHLPDVRNKIVEQLIDLKKPDLVIIDGVRDLVYDINMMDQATITVGMLMKLASHNDCHILCILHQNKGNEHARGHLGTELINKSETVVQVSLDDNKLTVCEAVFTRGQPFTPFAFDRDAYGMPVLVNYIAKLNTGETGRKATLPIDIAKATHYETIERAFGENIKMPYGEIVTAIGASFEYFGMKMGITKSKSFVQFYLQQRYILKAEEVANKSFYSINFALKSQLKLTPFENDEPPF